MVLASKAARGAGAPPAQSAQFGSAAVLHLAMDRDVSALNTALDALPDGPIIALPLALMRIAEAQVEGIATGVLDQFDAALAQTYVEALPCAAALTADGVVHLDLNRPAKCAVVTRIDLPEKTYAAWTPLAAVLLVPESDASRLSGAGAGLTDND